MHLTYKYRLLPTRAQHRALERILEDQRQLYNAALQERIECYRKTGVSRTLYDQQKALTAWRRSDEYAATTPVNIQRWTLRRIDEAYRVFFKRRKARRKGGYPRFRSADRWSTFGFREFTGLSFDGRRLRFNGLPGALRVHMHRPLPAHSRVRSCFLKKEVGGWVIGFQVEGEAADKRAVADAVGLDLGLKVFAHQSDGVVIPNPRIARKSERKMRLRQRALQRCKAGSRRREKVKAGLARLHRKISNARSTWLHQQSARIARSYDLVVAEDLNVAGMVKNPTFSRSIADASWVKFLAMVAYKAERAGGYFVTVDPKNTSQKCSGCSDLVPKTLAVRTHSCPSCGLVIDRDHNAALNILQAVVGLGQLNVAQWGERAAGNISAS